MVNLMYEFIIYINFLFLIVIVLTTTNIQIHIRNNVYDMNARNKM
jgi:hypothetical protein